MLAKIPNNSTNICPQLMRKYVSWSKQNSVECPVWERLAGTQRHDRGSVVDTTSSRARLQHMLMANTEHPIEHSFTEGLYQTYPPPASKNFKVLNGDDIDCLGVVYQHLYGDSHITVLEFVQSVKYVMQTGIKLEAQEHEDGAHGVILAKWAERDIETGCLVINPAADARPAMIRDLFLSTIIIRYGSKGKRLTHIMARLDWYTTHPQRRHFGADTGVWGTDFEQTSDATFMPLHRALVKCVTSTDNVQFTPFFQEKVYVVVPLHN